MATATANAGFVDCRCKTVIRRRENVPVRTGGWNNMVSLRTRRKNGRAMEATGNEASIGALSSRNDEDDIRFGISSLITLMMKEKSGDSRDRTAVSPEKLDEWTRGSVVEIMKNIKRAPFMVHVYSSSSSEEDSASPVSFRLETEPVEPRSWESVKQRWDDIGRSTPDGIILVEELMVVDKEERENCRQSKSRSSNKRTWGLLVQGRGVGCSACYILSTCRVVSSVGASTHFCLVRANCFGDSVDVQLMKSWLHR